MKVLTALFVLLITIILGGCCPQQSDPLLPVPTIVVETNLRKGFDLSVYRSGNTKEINFLPHTHLVVWQTSSGDSVYITPLPSAPAFTILSYESEGSLRQLLVRVKPRISHTFEYPAAPGDSITVVMGGFNDWSRTQLVMHDQDNDGILERTVYLRPERHEYKFVVDGMELTDPANPNTVSNNIGGWNSVLDLSKFAPVRGGFFMKQAYTQDSLQFQYLPPQDGANVQTTYILLDNAQLDMDRVICRSNGDISVTIRGIQQGTLRIAGLDTKGRVIGENITILENGLPLHPKTHPGDWHFVILYNILVDRFLDGNPGSTIQVNDPALHPLANWHGGDLAGIIQKLQEGYFTNLGISGLWLSPLNRQPDTSFTEYIPPSRNFTGYHGYWPVAPREIDTRFGSHQELYRLVDLAHTQNIKVILDFVSNHVHEEHPYFTSHPDWFGSVQLPDGSMNIRRWDGGTRLTTWFDTFLPSYDYVHSPNAIDAVVEDAIWWIKEFNLDGLRQDAVKHVPHRFWRSLTNSLRSRLPDKEYYQIGETFGSDDLISSYINPGELSAQFNFSIYFPARYSFSQDFNAMESLAETILRNIEVYGPVNLMGIPTSSHDQVRFMGFADGQVSFNENATERAFTNPPEPVQDQTSFAKLANFTAFNMSLPGIPVIYYGDEIGMIGAADPDNRRPMRFAPQLSQDEQILLNGVSNLTHLRRKFAALSIGDWIPLSMDGSVMILLKAYFDEKILLLLNQSPVDQSINLSVPFEGQKAKDLLTNETVLFDPSPTRLSLPPYSYKYLAVE